MTEIPDKSVEDCNEHRVCFFCEKPKTVMMWTEPRIGTSTTAVLVCKQCILDLGKRSGEWAKRNERS